MIVYGAKRKDFLELANKSDAVEIQINEVVAEPENYDLLKNLQVSKIVFLAVDPVTTEAIKSIS